MIKKILCLIVLILLVSGCSAIESITEEICEEKVKKIFPEKMTLYLSEGVWETKNSHWEIIDENWRWKDGSTMGKAAVYFRKGSKPGENVNYFYSSLPDLTGAVMETKEGFFTYEKAVIAEDETIIGYNLAFVSLTLNPIPETEGTLRQYKTKDFKIVDSNFSRCEWIKD